jgi:hypothetical protein
MSGYRTGEGCGAARQLAHPRLDSFVIQGLNLQLILPIQESSDAAGVHRGYSAWWQNGSNRSYESVSRRLASLE